MCRAILRSAGTERHSPLQVLLLFDGLGLPHQAAVRRLLPSDGLRDGHNAGSPLVPCLLGGTRLTSLGPSLELRPTRLGPNLEPHSDVGSKNKIRRNIISSLRFLTLVKIRSLKPTEGQKTK